MRENLSGFWAIHRIVAPSLCSLLYKCEQLLREDGWRTIRCEPLSIRSRGRGFGETGMADLLCLRYSGQTPGGCECLWVEWKARGGRVQKHQIEWHTKERARGP
jgi:hypothetical protein